MSEIIQDYGKTVKPQVYLDALQGHQYIPQSDQCIKNIVKKYYQKLNNPNTSLLEVGCGPERFKFWEVLNQNTAYPVDIFGIDISESFVNYSKSQHDYRKHSIYRKYLIHGNFVNFDFQKYFNEIGYLDFTKISDTWKSNSIVMQGVMHHVHDGDRKDFWENSRRLLTDDGILIIGDEFIRDYDKEIERRHWVMIFYLHIIDEARKSGFKELAEEEAKNLIDDYFSGTKYAGYGDRKVYGTIYYYAEKINKAFYEKGSMDIGSSLNNIVPSIELILQQEIEPLIGDNFENFNRGDYKVSIEKFVAEAVEHGFILSETYKFGPVDQLGGMGVLVFKKN